MRFPLGDDPTTTDTTAAAPSWLSQLAQAFTQFKLSQQQLNTANQITQINLQRAQAGLAPIQLDTSSMGVPSVSVGLSSGTKTLLQYALIGGGLLWLGSILLKKGR